MLGQIDFGSLPPRQCQCALVLLSFFWKKALNTEIVMLLGELHLWRAWCKHDMYDPTEGPFLKNHRSRMHTACLESSWTQSEVNGVCGYIFFLFIYQLEVPVSWLKTANIPIPFCACSVLLSFSKVPPNKMLGRFTLHLKSVKYWKTWKKCVPPMYEFI